MLASSPRRPYGVNEHRHGKQFLTNARPPSDVTRFQQVKQAMLNEALFYLPGLDAGQPSWYSMGSVRLRCTPTTFQAHNLELVVDFFKDPELQCLSSFWRIQHMHVAKATVRLGMNSLLPCRRDSSGVIEQVGFEKTGLRVAGKRGRFDSPI